MPLAIGISIGSVGILIFSVGILIVPERNFDRFYKEYEIVGIMIVGILIVGILIVT